MVSRNKLASYEKKRECKSQTNKIQFLAFIINTEDKVLAQKNTLWLKTQSKKIISYEHGKNGPLLLMSLHEAEWVALERDYEKR